MVVPQTDIIRNTIHITIHVWHEPQSKHIYVRMSANKWSAAKRKWHWNRDLFAPLRVVNVSLRVTNDTAVYSQKKKCSLWIESNCLLFFFQKIDSLKNHYCNSELCVCLCVVKRKKCGVTFSARVLYSNLPCITKAPIQTSHLKNLINPSSNPPRQADRKVWKKMKSSVLQKLTLLLRVLSQCVRVASRFGMNGWLSCKISAIISVCTFYRNNFGEVLHFVISLRFSFSKFWEKYGVFFPSICRKPCKVLDLVKCRVLWRQSPPCRLRV